MNYRTSHLAIALRGLMAAAMVGLLASGSTGLGAPLVINEFNAVDSGDYLDGGDYEDALDPIKEDAYFATIPGLDDGRIEGNGGNWIELVVAEDRLNIQGWALRWAETGAIATDGNDLWYGDADIEQGIITFSNTAPIWSDLRAGTIITISEKDAIGVDTTLDGDNRNFTRNIDEADVDVTIDLSTDTSYDPVGGDWWIHVSTRQEQADGTLLLSTVTNVDGDGVGDFSVGPDDWEVTIVDAGQNEVYGPVGEDSTGWGDISGGGGLSDREAGRLEAPPHDETWDPAGWAAAGPAYYDDSKSTSFGQPNAWGEPELDQDLSPLRALVPEPTSIALLISGGIALLLVWRRRRVA